MTSHRLLTLLTLGLLFFAPPAARGQAAANRPETPAPALPQSWVDALSWRSIGPANMSGRITALAVYEQDPSTWWAATASGGLLKTVNNGISFEHQFDREATVSIGDVQVAATDPNIVWVGTGEANPRNSVSWGDGVYKSTDGGKTWKNMGLKESFQIGRIAIHPNDPNVVYVGALGRLWGPNEQRGLYKTSDGGESWTKVLHVDDHTGVIDVQMSPADPNILLVATYERQRDGFDGNDPAKKFGAGSGLYLTHDAGESFERVTDGLPSCELGRIGISYFRSDPQQVFIVLESEKIGQVPDNAGYAGIRGENADVGARITEVLANSPAQAAGLRGGDIVVSVDGQMIYSYNELQTEIDRRAVGDGMKLGIVRERSGMDIELTLGNYPPRKQQREASTPLARQEQLRSGSKFAASLGGQRENQRQGPGEHEYGGVYHSQDGGRSWTRVNSVNPRPMYYSQIRVAPSDPKIVWVLGTQLYLSTDGGKTFAYENTARGVHVDHHAMWINPRDPRHVILGNDGGIYVTYDQGANWDHLNHVAIGQFYHVATDARRNYRVYGGLQDNGSWGGPSRGTDGGGPVNTDWLSIGGGDGFVCQVDPHDPDLIYYESQGGATARIHLRTGQRSSIRPQAPRGVTYRFNWKTPFVLSPHNPKIYYSAGNYVFRSLFEGNNIRAISPDITLTRQGTASALAESAVEEGMLYVGTTDGALWSSRDGGHTWSNLYGKPAEPVSKEPAETAPAPSDPDASSASAQEVEATEAATEAEDPAPKTEAEATTASESATPQPPLAGPLAELLSQYDANQDGQLQRDEVPERMLRMFDRWDTNQDQTVDQTELRAASQRTGRRGRGRGEAAGGSDPAEESVPSEPATEEPTAAETTEDPATEQAPASLSDPVTGTWEGAFQAEEMPADRSGISLILRFTPPNKVTGSFKSSNSEGTGEGTYQSEAKELALVIDTERARIEVSATIAGTEMTGTIDVNNGAFSVPFQARRTGDAPAEPAAAAEASAPPTAAAPPASGSLAELLPGPRWVSSIEASRFQRGRVYVTLDGHRSDDDRPYLFVSEDYGQTWRSLLANLPPGIGSTHVIREDVTNQNVLYLGTEFSIWVSVDRGASWTKLNSNLPTVAVHEIAVHPTAGEIVAGTHGRSLWILDVAALRQVTPDTIAADAHLYAPMSAIKWRSSPRRGSSGLRRFEGENPASGAVMYYSLGREAGAVAMKITDIAGRVVTEQQGETTAGLHRLTWDLRRRLPPQRPAAGQRSSPQPARPRIGGIVPSGSYLITLTVDDQEFRQVLVVENDPDAPAQARAEEAEEEWAEEWIDDEDD